LIKISLSTIVKTEQYKPLTTNFFPSGYVGQIG